MLLHDPRERSRAEKGCQSSSSNHARKCFPERLGHGSSECPSQYLDSLMCLSLIFLTFAGTHAEAASDDLGGFLGSGRPKSRPERWVLWCRAREAQAEDKPDAMAAVPQAEGQPNSWVELPLNTPWAQ